MSEQSSRRPGRPPTVMILNQRCVTIAEYAASTGMHIETVRKRWLRGGEAAVVAPRKDMGPGRPRDPQSAAEVARIAGRSRVWASKVFKRLGREAAFELARQIAADKAGGQR